MSILSRARLLLAAAALASAGSLAAAAETYTNIADFMAAVRADTDLETFDGPTELQLAPPRFLKSFGYAYTVSGDTGDSLIFRRPQGVGAASSTSPTRFVNFDRSASAMLATFHVLNQQGQSVGGPITISTDGGDQFDITVPAAGAVFGFTATQPFTTITVDATNGEFEAVDNLRLGIIAGVPQAADACTAAATIGFGAFPFSNHRAGTDGQMNACGYAVSIADVWYRLVAPVSGMYEISTCGSRFDTVLHVYDTCGGTQLDCADDGCGLSSHLLFPATAGEAYLIRIAGYAGATGSGILTIAPAAGCPGDFNHSGEVSPQDLFDFLAAFFAPCP